MKLTLIRHGETEGSRRDLYYGAADIPVLPDSLKALEEKAKAGVYPTAGRYCISGMLRTVQTLRALTAMCPTRCCRGCGRWISAILKCAPTPVIWKTTRPSARGARMRSTTSAPTERACRRCWSGACAPSSRCWMRGGHSVRHPRRRDLRADDALVRRHAVRLLPGAGHRISGDFPRRKAGEL